MIEVDSETRQAEMEDLVDQEQEQQKMEQLTILEQVMLEVILHQKERPMLEIVEMPIGVSMVRM